MSDNLPVKFPKEVSQFIEATANLMDGYYWLPSYYKKVGDGLFELVKYEDLPPNVKEFIEQLEKEGK